MSFFAVAALCLACVAFYVGLQHFVYYFRVKDQREHLPFSLVCLAIGAYNLTRASAYMATNAQQEILAQAAVLASVNFLGVFLLWFVSILTQRKYKVFDHGLSTLWLVELFLLALRPAWFASPAERFARPVMLFGRWSVTYWEVKPSALMCAHEIVYVVALFYILVSLVVFWRRGGGRRVKFLLAGLCCVIIGGLNDIAVSLGAYDSVYVVEWSFLLLIFGMSYALTTTHREVRNALNLTRTQTLRLAAAVNEAAESIVITDTMGKIEYVNPAFERMTGYSKEDCLGESPAIVGSGKHDALFYEDLWRTISGGQVWHGCFTNKRKDGSLFEEDATISPVHDGTGEIVNYVAVKRDVTQQIQLESQIRQSQKMAAVGQFAHKVAHDFSNALTVIGGNAQVIFGAAPKGSPLADQAKDIVSVSTKISDFNAELLAFSHTGRPRLRKMRLDKAIRGIEKVLKASLTDGVSLRINTAREIDRAMLDPEQIEEALVHLVVNANDAMPSGGVITTDIRMATPRELEFASGLTALHPEIKAGQKFVVLAINNSGAVISPEDLSRIFDPFFTTKQTNTHAGLGLAMVYKIVDQHRGLINVESRADKGTTFKIFLPSVENGAGDE